MTSNSGFWPTRQATNSPQLSLPKPKTWFNSHAKSKRLYNNKARLQAANCSCHSISLLTYHDTDTVTDPNPFPPNPVSSRLTKLWPIASVDKKISTRTLPKNSCCCQTNNCRMCVNVIKSATRPTPQSTCTWGSQHCQLALKVTEGHVKGA